jgi:hypothetical protein
MSKLGWIAYSVIVVGLLVISFLQSFYVGFAFIAGLGLGGWGSAVVHWERFFKYW